jgi:tetratricopeptide (TPR) repeat protein
MSTILQELESQIDSLVADGFDLAEYKRVEDNGDILINIDANASDVKALKARGLRIGATIESPAHRAAVAAERDEQREVDNLALEYAENGVPKSRSAVNTPGRTVIQRANKFTNYAGTFLYVEAHNNLASALYQAGRREEAVTHLETALRLDPNHRRAREQLAALRDRMGDAAGALEHKKRLAEAGASPEDPPKLPVDLEAPFLHANRPFMHLAFHIFDLGFHSPNSEAAKPTVFTTALLLITIVAILNIAAVWLRARLRKQFQAAQF